MDLSLTPTAACLPAVRHSAALELHGLATDVLDDVLLALDEAVSNAVRHGSRGGGPVEVSLSVDAGWVEARVRDRGPTRQVPRLPDGPPPMLATGGRGLWLMRQLADEVRLERRGPGTQLRFRRRAESRALPGGR